MSDPQHTIIVGEAAVGAASDCGCCDVEPSSSRRPFSTYELMYFEYSTDRSFTKTGCRCSIHQTGSWLRSAISRLYGA